MSVLGRVALDERALPQLVRRFGSVLDLTVQLPDSPFTDGGGAYAFCDFYHALRGHFGNSLQRLAQAQGDESVYLLSVPVLRSMRLVSGANYGTLKFPSAGVGNDYGRALVEWPENAVEGPLTDALMDFAVVGSSGRWAVWASRDWEIAIVHTQDADTGWRQDADYFVEAEEAFDHFSAPNLKAEFRTPEARGKFLRYFGGSVP
jgi:hypothetical protein